MCVLRSPDDDLAKSRRSPVRHSLLPSQLGWRSPVVLVGAGFRHEQITGPYLCANCDNMVFSQWENNFSRHVFADSMAATHQWGTASTLRFLASLVFRFALHNLRVAPTAVNQAQNGLFRDRGRAAAARSCSVREPAIRLSVCFPPDHRHMHLLPGVNYFLTTGFHSRVHRAEGPLPNCMMVLLPSILLLYSEADLTQTIDPDFAGYVNLRPGLSSTRLCQTRGCRNPSRLSSIRGSTRRWPIRRRTGWWRRWVNRADRRLFPQMVYQAGTWDAQLRDWQHANCPVRAITIINV